MPWHEGAEFVTALGSAGAPARHLIYNHVMHSDYVMSWKPRTGAAAAEAAEAMDAQPLRDFARDFLKLLRGLPRGGAQAAAARGGQAQGAAQVRGQAPLEGIAHLSRL